jgi:hypothetical protein
MYSKTKNEGEVYDLNKVIACVTFIPVFNIVIALPLTFWYLCTLSS